MPSMPFASLKSRATVFGVAVVMSLTFSGLAMVKISKAAENDPIVVILEADKFSPAEVKVPSGKPFVMKFINKDAAAAEIEAKDLKIEKVVAGKSEITVRVGAVKPGQYLFVNEYKEDTVKGLIIAE